MLSETRGDAILYDSKTISRRSTRLPRPILCRVSKRLRDPFSVLIS